MKEPNCGQLTWRAKDVIRLQRSGENTELWDFVGSWIRRFEETNEINVAERFIYLWVSVNAWAARSVPDLTRNHEDAYLVHCLAKDAALSLRFDSLYRDNDGFHSRVSEFLDLAPIFQALWLQNHHVTPWMKNMPRSEYVQYVFQRDPFITTSRNGQLTRFPAFAPACGFDHLERGEPIPADWPHALSMIYQVRCNLFHGGKSYSSNADRLFIELSCEILWDVWRYEIPYDIMPSLLPWHRILVRSGFKVKEMGGGISLADENVDNRQYLQQILTQGHFGNIQGDAFIPCDEYAEEALWLRTVESCHKGAEAGRADELCIMDTYMAGLVRWVNELGISSTFSCEGHGRSYPKIRFADAENTRLAVWVLSGTGANIQKSGRRCEVVFTGETFEPNILRQTPNLKQLLDIAEWIHGNKAHLAELLKIMRQTPEPRGGYHRFQNRPQKSSMRKTRP